MVATVGRDGAGCRRHPQASRAQRRETAAGRVRTGQAGEAAAVEDELPELEPEEPEVLELPDELPDEEDSELLALELLEPPEESAVEAAGVEAVPEERLSVL